jgi:putative membrane protein
MNARRFLSAEQLRRVEESVAEAERLTSAEIVCAVATESGRYDRAEGLCGLLVALGGLAAVHGLAGGAAPLASQAAAVALGYLAGNVLASTLRPLRMLLTTARERESEVRRAAWNVHGLRGVSTTRAASGILVYVSLSEQRVLVIGDHAVCRAVTAGGLEQLRELAESRLREGKRAEVFIDTIHAAAQMLSGPMPPADEEPDELSNHVGVFHPRP